MKTLLTCAVAVLLAACGGGGGGGGDSNPPATPGPQLLPTAPTEARVQSVAGNVLRVSWRDNANNESGYTVEFATEFAGPFVPRYLLSADALAVDERGLAAGSTYFWRVAATSAVGSSAYSNVASYTIPDPPAPADPAAERPAAPSNAEVQASASSARIAWVDNSANESRFVIERATAADGPFVARGVVGANARLFDDPGMEPGATYHWRVAADNAAGRSAFSNVVSLTVPALAPPVAPTNLSATVEGIGVNLRWTDGSTDETAFRLERAIADGDFAELSQTPANATSLRDVVLPPGEPVRYRVRASSAAGISAPSNIAAVQAPGVRRHRVVISQRTTGVATGRIVSADPPFSCASTYCLRDFPEGTVFDFSGLPDAGSMLAGWSGCDEVVAQRCRVTVDGVTDIVASFAPIPVVTINAAITPTVSVDGAYTLTWTATGSTGPWTVQSAADTSFTAPQESTWIDTNPPFATNFGLQPDGNHCYRLRAPQMPAGSWSAPACVTVARPATTGVLKITNRTAYRMVSMKINGQEQIGPQNFLPAGHEGAQALTPGTVNYQLGVGFFDNQGRAEAWFNLGGNATITAGGQTRVDFRLTVPDLLAGFRSHQDWTGEYWVGTSVHYRTYRFFRNGSWQRFDNGSAAPSASGSVSNPSWPNDALVVKFRTCATCREARLVYPFASFNMEDGSTDWPLVRFVARP